MGPPVPPNLPGVLTAGPGVGGCGARPTPRRSWGHTRMDRSPGRWHTCPSPGTRGPPGLLDGSLADFGDGEGAPLPLGLVTHGQPGRGPRTWLGSSLSLCHSTQCCQGLGLGVEPPTAAALHDVGDPWGRLGREAVRGPAAHDPNKAPSPLHIVPWSSPCQKEEGWDGCGEGAAARPLCVMARGQAAGGVALP